MERDIINFFAGKYYRKESSIVLVLFLGDIAICYIMETIKYNLLLKNKHYVY